MKLFTGNRKTQLLALAVILGAGYFVFSYTKSIPVKFITMKTETYKETFLASGILQMDNGILIKAEVDGTVKAVAVDAGGAVRKGDSLAVLENPDAVLRLDVANSEYRKAQANMAGTDALSEKTQLLVIAQLKLELENLSKEKNRYEQLAAQGAISDTELEAVQNDYEVKIAQISTEESRLQEIRNDSTASVGGAKAELERQAVGVRKAELDVQRLVVKAPFDGVVIRSDLKAGESVKAGEGIVFMAKNMNRYCEIEPDEKYLPLLKTGQSVSVYADQAADKPVKGEVAWISPEIEKDTGTVRVRIALLEDRPWLLQNMLLRCEVLIGTYPDSLTLPAGYILEGERTTVLVEKDGKAVERIITTNGIDRGKARIVTGLEVGEKVLEPNGLKAGARIKLSGEGAAGQ